MGGFQNILVIDTAMNACGAGVYRAGPDHRVSESDIIASGHAERLMPMIEGVLEEEEISYADLGAIIATIGPGAFTGLRIGLSAAKSLALALNIPLYGITTTQALALQYARQKPGNKGIAVIIETKRDDFYFQSFKPSGKPESEPAVLSAQGICEAIVGGSYVLIGDGAGRFLKTVKLKNAEADNFALIDCGLLGELFQKEGAGDVFIHNPEPVYLRGADVSSPKKPQRTLAET